MAERSKKFRPLQLINFMAKLIPRNFHVYGQLQFCDDISKEKFNCDIRSALLQPILNFNQFDIFIFLYGFYYIRAAIIDFGCLNEQTFSSQHISHLKYYRFFILLKYFFHSLLVGPKLTFNILFDTL